MIVAQFSDIGYVALLAALLVSAYSAVAAIVGRRVPALLTSAYRGVIAVASLVTLAALVLWLSLLNHDFGLRFVAETSSRSMDTLALLSAFWGGQEGSLLFWATMQALLMVLVLWKHRAQYPHLMPVIVAVLLSVQTFFLFVLTMVSNPFERVPLAPGDGRGLNPLLLDAGMRIHPPLLLTGYMSFSVPFAFAIAALVTGDLGRSWLKALRGWVLLSWAIQGAGLLMGAWWAYHVLGWGGYWGWDPVENAALLPWLIATALLHSIMVQERRGMLKVWNLGLAIGAFVLAVFGTFVVRSGVISSVHSFSLSVIGPYFFAFLTIVVLGAAGLLIYRLPSLKAEGHFDALLSREAGFLANNWLLLAVAGATFWGTIFPLLSEAIQGTKVAIGPQFYKQVNGPIFLGLIVLMGIGPLLAWRRTSRPSLLHNFTWPVVAAVAVTLALLALLGFATAGAAIAYGACTFVLGAIALEFARGVRTRKRAGSGPLRALRSLVAANRRRYGGYIVHLGIVAVAFGVIGSSFFQQTADIQLRPGESYTIGRYKVTYSGLSSYREPGVDAVAAALRVEGGNTSTLQLQAEKRVYTNWEQQPVTGVAIGTTFPWLDDVYILLTDSSTSGAAQVASFRIFINPLVSLIWFGGLLLLAGTVVAVWPHGLAVRRALPTTVPVPGGSLADA
ncbi:MAG: heme lyase CcmF/NrfE family subunit [Chloroflexi bacterium]|nr:heme lyase CcmF/NrfE family subunit [Chloroflexota bacterium]